MTDQHHLYTTGRFEIAVRVPPDACPAPSDQALDEASRRLRFRLPGGYRDFVKVCGAGTLAGYFRISAPCPDGSPWDLRRDCRENRGYLREWADDHDQLSRYAADLMPFGTSPYGDILAWLRSEANAGSGECPVYIVSRDDSAAHRLSDDFTGFLDEVCGGAKLTEIFNFSPPFSATHDFERAPAIRVEPAAIPQVDAGRWIPAIPLRDALAYPGVAVPLLIGRPRSIRAIDQAMMSDTPLVLPFQKDPQREDADEVHGWGCLAWVRQVVKRPDQSMKALIGAGIAREDGR